MQHRSESRKLFKANMPKGKNKWTETSVKEGRTQKHGGKQKCMGRIIDDLEKNLKALKKCYEDENQNLSVHNNKENKSSISRPRSHLSRSIPKIKSHAKIKNDSQNQTISPELEDVRRSFLSVNGYESNNLLELYHFFKKSMMGSTRITGSMSIDHSNHSQPPEQNKISKQENNHPNKAEKNHECKKNDNKKSIRSGICVTQLVKNGCQLVNVASLLAEKKKLPKQTVPNFQQCKKRLVRPPPENIDKFNQVKQNLRLENKPQNLRHQQKYEKSEDKIENISFQNKSEYQVTRRRDIEKIHEQMELISGKKKRETLGSQSMSSKKKQKGKAAVLLQQLLNSSQKEKEKSQTQIVDKRKILGDSLLQSQISARENSKLLDLEQIPFQL